MVAGGTIAAPPTQPGMVSGVNIGMAAVVGKPMVPLETPLPITAPAPMLRRPSGTPHMPAGNLVNPPSPAIGRGTGSKAALVVACPAVEPAALLNEAGCSGAA